MKINEIQASVGDQIKVEFQSHNRSFEMEGVLQDITPNCIRIDSTFLNVKIIDRILVDPATCQVCNQSYSEVDINLVDDEIDICVSCEQEIEKAEELLYIANAIEKANEEGDTAYVEELVEHRSHLELDVIS